GGGGRGGGGGGGGFSRAPDFPNDLAQAMLTKPRLMVEGGKGDYDMAAPVFAAEFTMTHLRFPADLQKKNKLGYYHAGHMMYLRDADRVTLHNNIADFIERATSSVPKP